MATGVSETCALLVLVGCSKYLAVEVGCSLLFLTVLLGLGLANRTASATEGRSALLTAGSRRHWQDMCIFLPSD